MDAPPTDERGDALDAGRAYAELDDVALTLVAGGEARAWLDDLVTTGVASLAAGESAPSLLLTPTGRIRASFHVLCLGERDFLLAQREPAPEAVGSALAPYLLSADVAIEPSRLRLFAIPGAEHAPDGFGTASRPSTLGGGVDLLVGASDGAALEEVRARLAADGLAAADANARERRRIVRGQPRFGVDLDADSLPAEAGLDAAPTTDRSKGCFLGQEAVAKVANLGHPPRVVVRIRAAEPVGAGDPVISGAETVGAITSAEGAHGLARIAWRARFAALRTPGGTRLTVASPLAEAL